jgi:exodeoxyribonuclease VII large subunit
LDCQLDAISQGASALVEAARRDVEANTRIVVGLGPQATLRRGFAIIRDVGGQPVTSRESAMGHPELIVEFQDGSVPVVIRDSREGMVDE